MPKAIVKQRMPESATVDQFFIEYEKKIYVRYYDCSYTNEQVTNMFEENMFVRKDEEE